MAGNVIDSLVVTLGLNSKGFADGIKGSSEQLAGFTRRLAGMFVAVRGIEDVVGYFKDLHHTLALVGFTSRNLGVTGTELKKLGEVSELFGGQMHDAADSVEGLQSAIFNLKYHGQVADSLAMLQRFGIAYLNAAGHARDFRDIARDAAKVIDRQRAQGADQGELTQLAQSFGFPGGIAAAVAQGSAGLEDALRKAQLDQRSLTDKTIQGQVRLDQSLTRMQERIDANSSVLLNRLTPAVNKANELLERIITWLEKKGLQLIEVLAKWIAEPHPHLEAAFGGLGQLVELLGPTGTLVTALGALTLALSPGGLLVGSIIALGVWIGTLIDKIPGFEEGVEKAAAKFYDWLGIETGNEENNAGNRQVVRGHIVRSVPTPNVPRPSAAPAPPPGTPVSAVGGGTNVQIDSITVNTQATDANSIAGDMAGAVRRKMLIASADAGLS